MYCRQLAGNITTEVLWLRLEPLLWYLPSDEDRQQVAAALQLAAQAHAGQTRKSGEPFITHPLEVTRILAEMRADTDSLIAGLLHDTVEDTEAVSFDDIEARFGTAVRRIVEGETKISKITRASPDGDDKAKDLQVCWECMRVS
jgi:GTP pyrophosphokinase